MWWDEEGEGRQRRAEIRATWTRKAQGMMDDDETGEKYVSYRFKILKILPNTGRQVLTVKSTQQTWQ